MTNYSSLFLEGRIRMQRRKRKCGILAYCCVLTQILYGAQAIACMPKMLDPIVPGDSSTRGAYFDEIPFLFEGDVGRRVCVPVLQHKEKTEEGRGNGSHSHPIKEMGHTMPTQEKKRVASVAKGGGGSEIAVERRRENGTEWDTGGERGARRTVTISFSPSSLEFILPPPSFFPPPSSLVSGQHVI